MNNSPTNNRGPNLRSPKLMAILFIAVIPQTDPPPVNFSRFRTMCGDTSCRFASVLLYYLWMFQQRTGINHTAGHEFLFPDLYRIILHENGPL